MELYHINYYLNGLLGLAPEGAKARKILIEEGAEATDIVELLEEWIWTFNLTEADLLKMKVWLGLDSYTLAQVFRRTPRDIAQLLRNQKVAALETYPSMERAHETQQISGLSCFMVEQYLSAWMDLELVEVKIAESLIEHLESCKPCSGRRDQYRSMQAELLSRRPSYPPVTEDEWKATLEHLRILSRSRWRRAIAVLVIVGVGGCALGWFILSKPEKIPNVYEIQENRDN